MTIILDKSYAQLCSSYLPKAMDWSSTPEGYDFWDAVATRLAHWSKGVDSKQHIIDEFSLRRPPGRVTPAGAHSSDIEAHPIVKELRDRAAAQVHIIGALQERVVDLERRNAALESKEKRFKAKLLAADFTSMGRV